MALSFEVFGSRALFSELVTGAGGEKQSYPVPTYEALKGIAKSIYWKPTFVYKIKKVRVMNPISFESMSMRMPCYDKNSVDLFNYMYLKDVRYQVLMNLEWNYNHPECANDRNFGKHSAMFFEALGKGGRFDIFLGKRDCPGFVKPCDFGSDVGAYDNVDVDFGFMYHSSIYPDEVERDDLRGKFSQAFWHAEMKNGILEFPAPCACQNIRIIKDMPVKVFGKEGKS